MSDVWTQEIPHQLAEHWWAFAFRGVVAIVLGVIAFLWPGMTLLALVYLAGVWAIVSGVFLVVGAARIHRVVHGRWLLILSGVFSVIWGVLLFVWPAAGLLVMTWWFGAYAIVFGIMLVAMSFRLRRMLPPGATHAHA